MKIYIPKNRIKEYRIRHDLTQKQLADRIHCSPQLISGFERGDLPIRLDYCYAICLALNATLDEIFWTFDNKSLPESFRKLHGLTSNENQQRPFLRTNAV